MIKLLFFTGNVDALAACQKVLQALDVTCEGVSETPELHRQLVARPCSGLLIDVLAAARCSARERALLQELTEYYPTLMLRWNSAARQFRGLVFGTTLDRDAPLEDFVSRFCCADRARVFRNNKRRTLHCNLLLSPDKGFAADSTEKTVTLNLSRSGCFIVTSRHWQRDCRGWIRLLELSDPTPIEVRIRQVLSWGKERRIPGIGVFFTGLRPEQSRQLAELCDNDSP